jgi:hypothetical protein
MEQGRVLDHRRGRRTPTRKGAGGGQLRVGARLRRCVPLCQAIRKIRDLALRSQDSGQLPQHIEPLRFLDWAKRNGIDAPVDLQEQVKTRSYDAEGSTLTLQSASQEASPEEKPLGTRERDTLLKLVIGMAVKNYGFDPQARRASEIPTIIHDLDSLGIPLDPKTVRKWLMQGADLLPRDHKEEP